MRTCRLFVAVLIPWLVPGGLGIGPAAAAPADVRVKDRAGLERALRDAKPGTRILVAPGTYAGGLHATGVHGTKAKPILVAAADPKRPPVFRGGTSGMHLTDPRHVELRDLVFEGATGNGLNIDDGGSKDTPAAHITLTRLVVRDVGPRGNHDGIKLSGVDRSGITDCRIEKWGGGGSAIDMVGCHDMTIAGCRIGPARGNRANGVQAKGGSRDVRITRCTFTDAGGRGVNIGGSTGMAYFRPKPEGYEAKDITVEDCSFSGGDAHVAFVGCDGALVRHNVFYRPRRWVMRILQETTADGFVPCRNGAFQQNVIVFRSDELRSAVNVGPGTEPKSFRFVHNAWFCADAPKTTAGRLRLPVPEKNGTYGADPNLRDPERGDFTFVRKGPMRGLGPR